MAAVDAFMSSAIEYRDGADCRIRLD